MRRVKEFISVVAAVALGLAISLAHADVRNVAASYALSPLTFLNSGTAVIANSAVAGSDIELQSTDDVMIRLAGTLRWTFDGASLLAASANANDIGSVASALATVHSNIFHGQLGQNVDFKSRNGAIDLYTVAADSAPLRRFRVLSSGDFTNDTTNGGNIIFARTGTTLAVDSGTAASACAGTGTHNGITAVTVTTTCAATGARIFFTDTSEPTTGSSCWVANIVNGTSFDVDCKLAGQDSTFAWWITKEG